MPEITRVRVATRTAAVVATFGVISGVFAITQSPGAATDALSQMGPPPTREQLAQLGQIFVIDTPRTSATGPDGPRIAALSS